MKLLQQNKKETELYNKLNNTKDETQEQTYNHLKILDNYLDEILKTPGLSNEDIYNIKIDQENIYKTLENITDSIDSINKDTNKCELNKSNQQPLPKSPNITININNDGEKNTKAKLLSLLKKNKIKLTNN
tara:strand:+ start:4165 stop:4557 length:393 start_codon:yes stop_codon:yes gene_type:complete